MKFKLGSLEIDAAAYGSQGNAVLGIRDSGKTYTATAIAEKLFESGVPFITFDPTGVWRFLRVPGAGQGYPVVVLGGKEGDLPLTVANAPVMVRAAMREGVSLVLNLTDPDLSKADWKRIVKSCVRLMLAENAEHGLRHIFIEEAAEFVPQRVLDGDVYAEVEKLARIGGNSRLGYTLINQRSQEVNKAVLELCENLFLHRQKGKNAIDSLSKWLEVAGVGVEKEITKSLPNLPAGHCWAWMGGSDEIPALIHVPAKNSFHPDRRALRGDVAAVGKPAVDVAGFVSSMKASLPAIEAEANANDPKLLRDEIARLKAELARAPGAPAADPRAYERGYAVGFDKALAMGVRALGDYWAHMLPDISKLRAALEELEQTHDHIYNTIEGRAEGAPDLSSVPQETWTNITGKWPHIEANLGRREPTPINWERHPSPPSYNSHPVSPAAPSAPAPARVVAPPPARSSSPAAASGDGNLSPALQKALNAIGWWRKVGQDPVERNRACVVAGLSPKASTFGVYVAELVKRGLVYIEPGKVGLTSQGIKVAVVPAGGSKTELFEIARGLLGGAAGRAFEIVYSKYPKPIRRDDVAAAMKLSPTASTTGVYLAEAAAYGLIETSGRGEVRASDWLFP